MICFTIQKHSMTKGKWEKDILDCPMTSSTSSAQVVWRIYYINVIIYFITKLGTDCLSCGCILQKISSSHSGVCKNIKNMKDVRTFYQATYSSGTCQMQKCIIFRWPWYHFTRVSASNAIVTFYLGSNPSKEVEINHPSFCFATLTYH